MSTDKSNLVFKRRTLHLPRFPSKKICTEGVPTQARVLSTFNKDQTRALDPSVLVINASHEMAKEITLHLSIELPGAGIIYAPTIALAKWILKRRPIDLIVSSRVLADGSISKLSAALEKLALPPALLVVGAKEVKSGDFLKNSRYQLLKQRELAESSSLSRLVSHSAAANQGLQLDKTLSDLGNDIRNDLNNPLQAIVAMVYVAQTGQSAPITDQSLDAIEKAAKKMAGIVNSLEGKIKQAVTPLKT